MYPRNITFHFNSPCEGWNLGNREVHLATPYGDSAKAGTFFGSVKFLLCSPMLTEQAIMMLACVPMQVSSLV